jgi:hypothetical protein
MTDDKQSDNVVRGVPEDNPGVFKGGLGSAAITPVPVAKTTTPEPPIKKGVGGSQITPIVAPENKPVAPPANPPA